MECFDVIVAGAGPAGASCAAFCALGGLRTALIERASFPREKVCGDCLNPDCWPVLERLGVAERIEAAPHVSLREVEFISASGRRLTLPLPLGRKGEVTVKRSVLDHIILDAAARAGAHVLCDTPVCAAAPSPGGFEVSGLNGAAWNARFVVAADGRNSVLARGAGLIPPSAAPRRVGLQTHVPCPADFGPRVEMHWFRRGYGGVAPVGDGLLNVSLVGPPDALDDLKHWTRRRCQPSVEPVWRTMAPLDRAPAPAATGAGLFLVGDAVRVVEPFTGEGIYFALRSGELAAQALVHAIHARQSAPEAAAAYRRASRDLYRGRLWVNRLARLAVLHPRATDLALAFARHRPGVLRMLTAKVVRA